LVTHQWNAHYRFILASAYPTALEEILSRNQFRWLVGILLVIIVLILLIAHPVTVSAEPRPNPCYDYWNLEAGKAEPTRQHEFNYLKPDGYARHRAACVYGWGTAEWNCLYKLWWEESRWGQLDPESIPQSKPPTKQAAFGEDWRTNQRVQVRWGEEYIHMRYGSPLNTPRRCKAGY
jgi:hypothetical protein